MRSVHVRFIITTLLLFLMDMSTPVQAQARFVAIGTGGITGVYYATGGAICRMVNRTRVDHGMRCREESSAGSVVNLDSLRRGVVNFAMVQSDLHFQAFTGQGSYAKAGPQEDLRSVFSIYPELITIVASKANPANSLDGLKNQRISLGMLGTGTRATVDTVLNKQAWTFNDMQPVVERSPDEQSYALCDDKIDAYVLVAGHPSPNVMRAVKECQAHLLGLPHAVINQMVTDHPYLVASDIPAGIYPEISKAVPSVGLMATLMTSSSVNESTVYAVTRAVFENLEEFKKLHPTFSRLEPKNMIKDGLTAPLHPGALRYFKEKGWL